MNAATALYNNRQEVINAFKTGIFPYKDGFQIKEESEEESQEKLKNQKINSKNSLNILKKKNQGASTMIYSKSILAFQYPVPWQQDFMI